MTAPPGETHIVKKMSPMQAGAKKLARRYGDALICVRYRHNAEGTTRYTTVELVVESVAVQKRSAADALVGVKLEFDDRTLRAVVQASGAEWDAKAKLWRMPRRVAKHLDLLARVEKE